MPHALICSILLATVLQGPTQGPPPGGGGRRPGMAAADGQPTEATPSIEIQSSVTHHTLPSGLAYTATAAQIPIRNEAGDVECRMFYVSYAKDGADAHSRPVTFAFNGGPGSASLWLHMGALGPKRAPMNDDGSLPAPPYQAIDNADTWLDFTDVVVIDAPATGFSRLVKPELGPKFFGVRPDIEAFTAFVRTWLTKEHRWKSPLFIAGESYGGIRGSGLSENLFRSGIAVSGFVSISGTSNFLTLDNLRGNDSSYIGFLPSMAAVAWYHHKLSPRFKDAASVVAESQKWIDEEYAAALERGDSLSDSEKDHIAAKLSEYLGLSKQYCRGSNLRIPAGRFFRELLRDQGLTIGRYDGRLVGREELTVGDRGSGDPSDDATTSPFVTSLNGYLEDDLGVKTDMTYNVFGDVDPWHEEEGTYSETASDLRTLLARNTHFKVLYCCGYFDLACPLNATIYTVNHMGLDPDSRSRVSFAYFPAGHMMYIEKVSRKKLHDDVKAFEASCLGGA